MTDFLKIAMGNAETRDALAELIVEELKENNDIYAMYRG